MEIASEYCFDYVVAVQGQPTQQCCGFQIFRSLH